MRTVPADCGLRRQMEERVDLRLFCLVRTLASYRASCLNHLSVIVDWVSKVLHLMHGISREKP
jgi:hypothetical protein